MQALGLIETEGVLAAIVSVDTMLKAADVRLVDKTYVGGGLVSVSVTGDVSAVKVAVEAGAASVNTLDNSLLVSQHVIPRPQEDIKDIIKSEGSVIDEIFSDVNLKENEKRKVKEEVVEVEAEAKKEKKKEEKVDEENNEKIDFKKLKNKKDVDNAVKNYGLNITIEALEEFKVVELRKLARKYNDFGIKGREISSAGKKLLITEFKNYYGKDNVDKK